MVPTETPPQPCVTPSPLLPTLRGESDLDEWEDLLIKFLRAKKLEHVIKDPRRYPGPPAPEKSPTGKERRNTGATEAVLASKQIEKKPERNGARPGSSRSAKKTEAIPKISLEFLDDILGGSSGGEAGPSTTADTQDKGKNGDDEAPAEVDGDTSVDAARDGGLERAQVLVLLGASISPVRHWLLNQGWDAGETDPARYFWSIKDAFSRNASVNGDLEINELKFISSTSFDTIRAFQDRLQYLRGRMLLIGHLSGAEGDTKMLWYAIDGLKKTYPEIHARLVKDLLAKEGSPRKLTWSRLMMQLAHMHERKEKKREPYYALMRSSG
ncbi:hypothetical protein GGTG_11479 [Gaeumannomyces tritici R3-111a-1]|uniref:Uncharacterized protein n=1 Tax=Gaeumannomyces tritici (strain R3-111a-1) TaxID=644352 RepID=J3PDB1_GAET3|nr:hypothetical protein GGTG_11479 [Gaeumannomyces tritici R3-111a-1]EJT70456.1 hypothetical protein GGTG_11479 [Gaeumannomyces tritici R3-111a-1]